METIKVIDYSDFPRTMNVKLAIVAVSKKDGCNGCIFNKGFGYCNRSYSGAGPKVEEMQCVGQWRYDGQDVIFRLATDEEIEKYGDYIRHYPKSF